MSKGSRCPFDFILSTKEDQDQNDKIISFKQPIDPNDPDGIKLTHNAKICDSTFVKDILKHDLQFTQLQDNMNLNNIAKRKAIYVATHFPSLQPTWHQACINAPVNANYNNMNLLQFVNVRE